MRGILLLKEIVKNPVPFHLDAGDFERLRV